MCNLEEFRYRKISQNATVNDLVKELVRKSIHISAALTVLLARFWYGLTLGLVAGGVVDQLLWESAFYFHCCFLKPQLRRLLFSR